MFNIEVISNICAFLMDTLKIESPSATLVSQNIVMQNTPFQQILETLSGEFVYVFRFLIIAEIIIIVLALIFSPLQYALTQAQNANPVNHY